MMSPIQLGKMIRVPVREAWKHEASEFTPWLAEQDNLNALADALGLSELIFTETEYPVGDFQLDILCSDGDEQVVIENQLEETDHRHLGQVLAYAAGVGARKVIWVADSFRPEHASALEYLNENTTDELAFFGVQVELWQIDESNFAPKFEVVVKPNDWTKTGRMQAKAATDASPTQQLQLKFWNVLVAHLAQNAPHIRPYKPRAQHWLSASIGRSGFELTVTANTRHERIGVELYMPGTHAKRRFANLLERQEEIESALGFDLDWQELPTRTGSRIATWLEEAALSDEDRWEEYKEWASKQLVKMDEVLRPIIRDLP